MAIHDVSPAHFDHKVATEKVPVVVEFSIAGTEISEYSKDVFTRSVAAVHGRAVMFKVDTGGDEDFAQAHGVTAYPTYAVYNGAEQLVQWIDDEAQFNWDNLMKALSPIMTDSDPSALIQDISKERFADRLAAVSLPVLVDFHEAG